MADLSSMPWSDLYQLRMKTTDPLQQAMIAPYEHRAYAREQVQDNPLMAPVFAAAVPAYQAFKAITGPEDATSTPPSWAQVKQGYQGIGEGLYQALAQRLLAR